MADLNIMALVAAYEADPGGEETVAQLAGGFGLDADIVKVVLKTHSVTYRIRQEQLAELGGAADPVINPHNERPVLDTPDDVLAAIHQSMITTALSADDPRLRFKAGCRIIDERMGRLDKANVTINNNLNLIANHFAEVKRQRALKRANAITVPALPAGDLSGGARPGGVSEVVTDAIPA